MGKIIIFLAGGYVALTIYLISNRDSVAPVAESKEDDSEQIRLLRVEEAQAWVRLHSSRVASAKLEREADLLELEMCQYTYDRLYALMDSVPLKSVKEAEIELRKAKIALRDDVTQLSEAEAELDVAKARLKLAEEGESLNQAISAFLPCKSLGFADRFQFLKVFRFSPRCRCASPSLFRPREGRFPGHAQSTQNSCAMAKKSAALMTPAPRQNPTQITIISRLVIMPTA